MTRLFLIAISFLCWGSTASAQSLTVSTVSRAPFSMVEGGQDVGFSMDLWDAIAQDLGNDFTVKRHDTFSDMLKAVETGQSDLAIANISITAQREHSMDFSHPIFSSGIRIMVPKDANSSFSALRGIVSWELFFAIIGAFGLLLLCGMLMWRFERADQEYFEKPAKEAVFPAFWWALNLIVNGGFEERVPRTGFGRLFGVILVISSLFIVSIFVARITTVMTVSAIETSVTSTNGLYGKRVGTITNSTAAKFLQKRDIRMRDFDDLETMLADFEAGALDAVVFDAPILAYYVNTTGADFARLAGPTFQHESYGIVAPPGSQLIEPINQSLLKLREDGVYDELHLKWFGEAP